MERRSSLPPPPPKPAVRLKAGDRVVRISNGMPSYDTVVRLQSPTPDSSIIVTQQGAFRPQTGESISSNDQRILYVGQPIAIAHIAHPHVLVTRDAIGSITSVWSVRTEVGNIEFGTVYGTINVEGYTAHAYVTTAQRETLRVWLALREKINQTLPAFTVPAETLRNFAMAHGLYLDKD